MSIEAPALRSAVYEGIVSHRRLGPKPHYFEYRLCQLYLDLDELERVFAGRWLWSVRRGNLAQFRRSDFFGARSLPLTQAIRDRIEQSTGCRPDGPIRLLAHLRYAGYIFNPVSFYYCYAADGTLNSILAEITNTPWRERHAYTLPLKTARRRDDSWEWEFPKAFHVSPFVGMARQYVWRFSAPDDELRVGMLVYDGGERELEAYLHLRRHPLNGANLARVLWRFPLMTAQVIGAIHWQALRLWLKRTPVHDHPPPLRGAH